MQKVMSSREFWVMSLQYMSMFSGSNACVASLTPLQWFPLFTGKEKSTFAMPVDGSEFWRLFARTYKMSHLPLQKDKKSELSTSRTPPVRGQKRGEAQEECLFGGARGYWERSQWGIIWTHRFGGELISPSPAFKGLPRSERKRVWMAYSDILASGSLV